MRRLLFCCSAARSKRSLLFSRQPVCYMSKDLHMEQDCDGTPRSVSERNRLLWRFSIF